MGFPFGILDKVGVEELIAFVVEIAEMVPFQSGNVGYAFHQDMIRPDDAMAAVVKWLPRYLGFDPSYELVTLDMKGCTPSAHWINFLSDKMVKKVGGAKAIKAALPACDVRVLENGIFVRAARLPPIGDVQRNSSDIGFLPDVARLLRPTRIALEAMGMPTKTFDSLAWLARFDDLPSKPWDQQ